MPGSSRPGPEPVDAVKQRVLVDVQGDLQRVSAAMLVSDGEDLPQVGDWVVVHLGFALSRMDEAEARTVLDGLQVLYAGELPA
ncbi:MAG: HypC/HybG/HupF family hydrogenase formation chaperone [Actinomycetota bacterium]|nr:HypC/HybG/HupF family hydrogenase formation chaperone [Actinomycetota bacterium]MDQ3465790.1 HypC/HybG/HupF family hydrogenase formation chaperone [Actinomycetota bacterium]